MKTSSRITLNNLSFHLEHTKVAFNDITMSFANLRYGIVGDNGVGKTTFLKLLSGKLLPDQGSLECHGCIMALPQSHAQFEPTATIADVLEVADKLAALKRINQGSVDEKDFTCVGNDWELEQRIATALTTYQLWPIDLSIGFTQLSGGQKTKILLAKSLVHTADFILFDEPTNNLDQESRQVLYQFVESCQQGLIIVSHDRKLLNRMDRIIEITTKGIHIFGGNYDFYRRQKDLELQALQQEYSYAKKSIKKAAQSIQKTREAHEQRASKGKKDYFRGRVDKVTADFRKDKHDNNKSRIATKEARIISKHQQQLVVIHEKIEIKDDLNINLEATRVPNGKTVLAIENLCFQYPTSPDRLINQFNLQIIGPQRVAITGPNGCGKSTLIKLILGKLKPLSGTINIGVNHIAYLDQDVSFLDKELTLVENFLKLNPDSQINNAYSALAAFNFRNTDAEKKVRALSGGESMRAGLAISLMSKYPPQLIILDEPTNHLDLTSIKTIETALKAYQGAILAVSHDETFLNNIGINRLIACLI